VKSVVEGDLCGLFTPPPPLSVAPAVLRCGGFILEYRGRGLAEGLDRVSSIGCTLTAGGLLQRSSSVTGCDDVYDVGSRFHK